MKFKDKVSIIIPTYNREKTLKKSILSVSNQTYDNIEIIIVDDASTDNTKEIVKEIIKKDNRVKYYSYKTNKGACYARNYGIKKATGKYISFQDSDDEYVIDKIERQYENLIKNKSDMDFCKISINNDNSTIIIPAQNHVNSIKNNMVVEELCNGNFISTVAIFVKKEIVERYMFDDDLPRLQDYDLVLRMVPNIKTSFTDKALVNAFVSNDSISKSDEKLKAAISDMLGKKYNLNKELQKILNETLLKTYIIKIENYYNKQIDDLKNENELNVNDLKSEIDSLRNTLNNIYNSKGYKLLNFFYKLKNKFNKKQ